MSGVSSPVALRITAARTSAEALQETLDRASRVEGLAGLRSATEVRRNNAILMGQTIDGYRW